MPDKKRHTRRSFVRKVAATSAVGGGILGSTQTVAAATWKLEVTGYQDGSDYFFAVNDPNATGGNLESGDGVTQYDTYSTLSGTVNDGDKDHFDYSGEIMFADLDGDLDAFIDNPTSDLTGHVYVSGPSDVDYGFQVVDYLSKDGGCESNDELYDGDGDGYNDGVNGTTDTSDDQYYRQGGFTYLTTWPGGSVEFDTDLN